MLYQSHVAPQNPSTPATRRAAEELRAARQPAQAFGSRVHRQLRGRWFSLVPVSRLAVTIAVAAVAGLAISLTVLHHLAVTWPALAYREGIARPLRIDRPDSFAAWWTTMVLVLAAGAMRLIYVLRRHRRDDYRGHYQLWRLTLIVLLLASIQSTVGLVAWLGAFLDLAFGVRAVLSGANWFRIALDVGGIVLAMRLISEVYHCRPALVAMVCAAAFFGVAEAAAWQLFAVDTMTRSTLVIAGPMLGSSCLLIAATIYLRALYRQVRNIADAPSVRERLRRWMEERRERDDEKALDLSEMTRPIQRPKAVAASDAPSKRPAAEQAANQIDKKETPDAESGDEEQNATKTKKPGLFSRFRRPRIEAEPDSVDESAAKESQKGESHDDAATNAKPKRRWFGLRAPRPMDNDDHAVLSDSSDSQSPEARSPESESPAPRKRRFSLRLKPKLTETLNNASSDDTSDTSEDEATLPKKKGWFGGLMGRKKTVEEDNEGSSDGSGHSESHASPSKSSGPLASRSSQRTAKRESGPLSSSARNTNRNQPMADDDTIDPDSIDWDSMSKAERRRMRKKLKRSGRAA